MLHASLLTTSFLKDNELIIGTLGGGAKKYDLDNEVYSDFSSGMDVSSIRAIEPMPNGNILISTDAHKYYLSEDNGLTWESISNGWTMSFQSGNDGSIYDGTYGGIMKSEDFGKTWKKINIGSSNNYTSAIEISEDSKTICVGTHKGEVYVSNSSGESFVKIKEENDQSVDLIKVIDSEKFLIVNGPLYYTEDGGKTLIEIEDTLINKNTLTGCVIDNLGYIYLSSYRGVFRSLDGINWVLLTKSITGINFLEIDQFNNIYAATSGGTVYYSNNHGKEWEMVGEKIPYTSFWSFNITSDGYIFYGSQDRGLYRLKPEIKNAEFNDIVITKNFPNPFNASTRIEYTLKVDSFVELEIYDLIGRKVKTLISEFKNIGEHFVYWHPEKQASGVYFSRLKIGSENQVNKMIYLK